jgi:hypothetical protein
MGTTVCELSSWKTVVAVIMKSCHRENLSLYTTSWGREVVADGGGLNLVVCERPSTAAGDGDRVNAPNEANFCDDVCIAQHHEIIEVPTNSGGGSGLDACQTKPILLETKPIPAGGAEAGGVGGLTAPEARPLTERERRDAWMEVARREWIRQRAEKEARAREQRAALDARGINAGASSATSGDATPSHDVRGP